MLVNKFGHFKVLLWFSSVFVCFLGGFVFETYCLIPRDFLLRSQPSSPQKTPWERFLAQSEIEPPIGESPISSPPKKTKRYPPGNPDTSKRSKLGGETMEVSLWRGAIFLQFKCWWASTCPQWVKLMQKLTEQKTDTEFQTFQ